VKFHDDLLATLINPRRTDATQFRADARFYLANFGGCGHGVYAIWPRATKHVDACILARLA